jgi:hypothetical protein
LLTIQYGVPSIDGFWPGGSTSAKEKDAPKSAEHTKGKTTNGDQQ